MVPLIYGYMRVASEAEDDEIAQIERGLRAFADAELHANAQVLSVDERSWTGPVSADEVVIRLG